MTASLAQYFFYLLYRFLFEDTVQSTEFTGYFPAFQAARIIRYLLFKTERRFFQFLNGICYPVFAVEFGARMAESDIQQEAFYHVCFPDEPCAFVQTLFSGYDHLPDSLDMRSQHKFGFQGCYL